MDLYTLTERISTVISWFLNDLYGESRPPDTIEPFSIDMGVFTIEFLPYRIPCGSSPGRFVFTVESRSLELYCTSDYLRVAHRTIDEIYYHHLHTSIVPDSDWCFEKWKQVQAVLAKQLDKAREGRKRLMYELMERHATDLVVTARALKHRALGLVTIIQLADDDYVVNRCLQGLNGEVDESSYKTLLTSVSNLAGAYLNTLSLYLGTMGSNRVVTKRIDNIVVRVARGYVIPDVKCYYVLDSTDDVHTIDVDYDEALNLNVLHPQSHLIGLQIQQACLYRLDRLLDLCRGMLEM